MINSQLVRFGVPTLLLAMLSLPAAAQSFRVQCPYSTITHPASAPVSPIPAGGNVNSFEPAYAGPTTFTSTAAGDPATYPVSGYLVPTKNINGAIKCQQISGGDGYSTMADGTQTFMYSFGPLSGLADIANGQPGTEVPDVFNTTYLAYNGGASLAPGVALPLLPANVSPLMPGDPATTDGASGGGAYAQGTWINPAFTYNGAIGQTPDATCAAEPASCATNLPATLTSGQFAYVDGHVDPRQIMDIGVMNGNIPAPLMAFDEDDEFFLTLTNVGMLMRPDLFEQHTVHFHGYPNASPFYDGVPDASVAINIGGSFTYYYFAPDAGTYFWHCHITPPEHLQMGMVGQLYVRPRQNRVAVNNSLYTALQMQQGDPRTACNTASDVLCSNPLPPSNTVVQVPETVGTPATNPNYGQPRKYVYNDGDGSTGYDVEYPIQIHGFDPNFHFVGMTFNPEAFVDMKDKYFLLNGRSYPDTVSPGPQATQSSDGKMHYSQPLPTIINIPAGGKALLRIADLSVTEYGTLASLGIPMHVVGYNAKLLRDQEGNNLDYYTNSITIGGGESLDVILDASNTTLYPAGSVFYLYTPQLDHLSNDAENFGGLMTEVRIN
jgi:hypothetical protein